MSLKAVKAPTPARVNASELLSSPASNPAYLTFTFGPQALAVSRLSRRCGLPPSTALVVAEIMSMEVTSADRAAAFDLDRRVVLRILDEQSNLSVNGFWADGCQSREAFSADRIAMCDLRHIAQFQRALAFLLLCCGRRKTLNRRATSYGFKHAAERAMRGLGVPDPYVSNGAFIMAAIALGFRVEHIEGTPNAWLDINVVRERCK